MNFKISAILLNWKRPENLKRIIGALREQTVPIEIVVWNNGAEESFPDADWEILSTRNSGCLARWHVGAMTDADYVFCIDDDLLPKDPNLIANCAERSNGDGNTRIIGRSGRTIGPAPRYYRLGKSVGTSPSEDRYSDIVKGRFMFMHRSLLSLVPLGFMEYEGRGDDIWISLHTAKEKKHHLLPAFVSGAFEELPDLGVGLTYQKSHFIKRDRVVSSMFAKNQVAWTKSTVRKRWVDRLLRHGWTRRSR